MDIRDLNISIEVTRRCNMKCEHCLRGDAQDIDLKHKVLYTLINEITSDKILVTSLNFTGGEPLLNVKMITSALKLLMQSKKSFCLPNFDIITNGTIWNDDFVLTLIKYNARIIEQDGVSYSSIMISEDQFHDGPDYDFKEMYKCLSFYMDEKEKTIQDKYIINEGRAYYNGIGQSGRTGDTIHDSTVYITCMGDVLIGCNRSYENMSDHIIGNILQNPLAKILKNYDLKIG